MSNDSQRDDSSSTGVLLVNLGTPDAPTVPAVRRFLAEFLSDPRVIDLPRWFWLPVLYLVVLVIRPFRSVRAYKKVWTESGSPLMVISKKQRDALQQEQASCDNAMPVALSMRYGQPSIKTALQKLREHKCNRIVVLPLYPQFSVTTTASVDDALRTVLAAMRWHPDIAFVNNYHAEPKYIDALAKSIESHWMEHGRADILLMSFHGIPQHFVDAGDPYFEQCKATAALLAERLHLDDNRWAIGFQSRVGREAWLKPYTDLLLKKWAAEGVRRVDTVCPGFSADCLETLEEIAIQNRESFIAAGGESLSYIAALNDRNEHIRFLADLVTRHSS